VAPSGTQYLGFDVFNYKQYDANLYGSEVSFGLYFPFYDKLKWQSDFSVVKGELSGGTYLPFIPPAKWTNELRFKCTDRKKIKKAAVFMQAENRFSQKHPAEFETKTAAYCLLNAGFSGNFQTGSREIVFSITGNNLLNKYYYDHLSRFKDYGIHNIGINFVFHMSIPFTIHSKK
jgi:iron complex outermembrane receptor protein